MVNINELRAKAEKVLKEQERPNESITKMDVVSLVEELSIYQIELEHQNNELRESQEKLLQAKERYGDLFNNAPIGYIIIDKSHFIKEINNTACNILNADASGLAESSFDNLIHSDFRDLFESNFKFVSTSMQPNSCDLKMRKPGCRSIFARLIIAPDRQSAKDSTLFRIALIDISIEKELEMKLMIETEKAKQSDKLKSVFLANMGHEIRTPLNGIMGFSNLLMDGEDDPEVIKKYAGIINRNGFRLLQMISNILDISQIDSGNLPVKTEPFAPDKIVNNVIELFSAKAKKNNLEIIRVFKNKSELDIIYSDPDKVTQVLINIFSNAIKFTKDGNVKIGFHIKEQHIIFSVKDTGIGIPDNAREFLFDRFYQAENSLLGSDEGTGLGLAISKSIVEMLEGNIWYHSELNKGTEFYFSIPINR